MKHLCNNLPRTAAPL